MTLEDFQPAPGTGWTFTFSFSFSVDMRWLATRLLPLFVCLLCFATAGKASVSHPACYSLDALPSSVYRFSADLDGVDGSDVFIADRTGDSTVITACDYISLGPWDMRDTNKPLNTVVVVDVEGDGTEELIIGGATGSSPLSGTVTRLVGTQLERREPVAVKPASDLHDGQTFRCVDTDGDGLREIINYTYSENMDGSVLRWRDSNGHEGLFKLPDQLTDAWLFRSGQCADRVVVNVDFPVNGYPQSVVLETIKSHLAAGRPVQFGINNNLLFEKRPGELKNAVDWVIPVETYAGYEGPFTVLNLLEKAQKLTVGPHNHCVAQPLEPPEFTEKNLIQLSVQPSQTNSCLQWFSVDFWVRQNFTIAAVVLNIWEP